MELDLNWMAVIVATIVNMALGYAWYSPLFGKVWAKAVGVTDEQLKQRATGPLIVTGVMSLLTAYAVAYFFNFVTYDYDLMSGLRLGAELGIGILLPAILTITLYQRKSITLFFIDWGYRFIGLLLIGMIIGNMGI